MFVELLIFLSALSIWWYWKKVWIYPTNFPPGPRFPLPVLGDAIALGSEPPVNLKKLHQKHGDLVGFLFGSYLTVSVRDFPTLQKILAMKEYSHRTPQPGMELHRRKVDENEPYIENTSIIHGSGPSWEIMRRFTFRWNRHRPYIILTSL